MNSSDTLAASETMESKIEKCMDIGTVLPSTWRLLKFSQKSLAEILESNPILAKSTHGFSPRKS